MSKFKINCMKFFEILIDLSSSCGRCNINGEKMMDFLRFAGLISGEKLPMFGIKANKICICFVNKIHVFVFISFPVSSTIKMQTRLINSTIASLSITCNRIYFGVEKKIKNGKKTCVPFTLSYLM